MHDVGEWLRKIGLGKYDQLFAENEIDAVVLPELDDDDLKDLGIALGHRRKLLKAITELCQKGVAADQAKAPDSDKHRRMYSSEPREAERRQLTVMFCDLVGSTALSEELDPEDLAVVIQDYRNACAKIITRFDGFIARYVGDGILIYFGYPHAHEDDSERSVRAALELIKSVSTLKPMGDLSLKVRIGIATGLVLVGDLIGTGTSEENAVVGHTPNLASRLQSLSEPNTVVISEATHRLIDGLFVCDDLGRVQLTGITGTVRAFRVVDLSDSPTRFEASVAKGISPLVGRKEEIALLANRWELGNEEEGQVVLLSGEPGVGKSRIIKAFRDKLADQVHERALFFCSSHHKSSAFYPLIEILERRLRFTDGDSPQQKLERLEVLLSELGIAPAENIPWLASLLSIPLENDDPMLGLSPQQLKRKILETLLMLLIVMAERKPLLIVIEDLQWADPSTLEFIGELIDRMRSSRITLIGSFRPEFQNPWFERSHITAITLNRMSRKDCRVLIASLTRRKTLSDSLVDEIVAKADGMPLFIEELTKNVLEADALKGEDHQDAVSGLEPKIDIPSSLQDSLMARIDHRGLSKAVIQLAAALGRSFSYELISAIWSEDEDGLRPALSELVSAGLIFQRGSSKQAEYEFKHALVQEAAYKSLLRTTRRRHHRRIVRVLEEKFPNVAKTRPETLAHHSFYGGALDKVIQYAFAAGQKSFDRSANREAVIHLDHALEALNQLPQSRETLEKTIDVRLLLRYALLPLGEVDRIGQVLRDTAPLIASLNDPERTGQFQARLCNYYCLTGDQSEALAQGRQGMRIAQDLGDENLQVEMAYRLGQPYYHLGQYGNAIKVLKQGVELIRSERELDKQGKAAHPAVVCRTWLAMCCAELGDFAIGTEYAQHAVDLAQEVRHSLSTLFSLWGYGHIRMRECNYAEALRAFEEALEVCQRSTVLFWYPRLASSVAMARALGGSPGDTNSLVAEARRSAAEMNLTVDDPRLLERMASIHLMDGNLEAAESDARAALELALKMKAKGYEAWALRRLGEIYAVGDHAKPGDAEKHFKKALALSQELSMRPLSAFCYEGIGKFYEVRGQTEKAQTAFDAASEIRDGLRAQGQKTEETAARD